MVDGMFMLSLIGCVNVDTFHAVPQHLPWSRRGRRRCESICLYLGVGVRGRIFVGGMWNPASRRGCESLYQLKGQVLAEVTGLMKPKLFILAGIGRLGGFTGQGK